METKRASLRIKGHVQGVFYRQSAKDQAVRLGLRGWVKNLRGGDVEAVAEGPEDLVEELIAWCRRGPPAAMVSQVQVAWGPATGEFTGFEVEH